MIYIKCGKCFYVHSTFIPNSFTVCSCGGQMKLIKVPDEQHRRAVDALQEYMDTLVTESLELVQEIKGASELPDEYESWSANWLLKNSDARRYEDIELICTLVDFQRRYEDNRVLEAAEWATITADAAERAVSWFKEGNIHDALWWISHAIYSAEAVKGLSDYQTGVNYQTRKAEALTLLKENGYDVAL